MKIKILIIPLLTLWLESRCQNLTIRDLMTLSSKSTWNEVDNYLSKKNWEYFESTKEEKVNIKTITWSFEKSEFNERAKGWTHLYIFNDQLSKLDFSFFNSQVYNSLKNEISGLKLKLIDDSVEDDIISAKYVSGTFIITTTIEKIRNNESSFDDNASATAYHISVFKRGSIYDSNNGEKLEYWSNGKIRTEYTLSDGKLHGSLKKYFENGNIEQIGAYTFGKENGKFVEFNEDGSMSSEYTMINGEETGTTIIYEGGLRKQEISRQKGIENGRFTEYSYDENGGLYLKKSGNFINGVEDGLWQTLLISSGKSEVAEFVSYLNGIKNGLFKEYKSSDTLETGNYINEVLDGKYTREVLNNSYWYIDCDGTYKQGIKTGRWTYYFFGNKYEEGSYVNGKKEGKWISYLALGNNIKKIRSETSYRNGIEDGLFLAFYKTEIIYEGLSGKFHNSPILETYTYVNALKEGEYLLKDSTGEVISKGRYSRDRKSGDWIECNGSKSINIANNRTFKKGHYENGLKVGKWEEYLSNGVLVSREFYTGGKLLTKELFDPTGSATLSKYEFQDDSTKCTVTIFKDEMALSQVYTITNDFDPEDFPRHFLLNDSNYFTNNEDGYQDGQFVIRDIDGSLLMEGNYHKHDATGLWRYYYYDIGVCEENQKDIELKETDKFYILNSKKPFSGIFLQKHPNGNKKLEFNIVNGVRHGKSKYYDDSGHLTSVEVYKNGILKK